MWLPEAGELEKRLETSLVDLNDIHMRLRSSTTARLLIRAGLSMWHGGLILSTRSCRSTGARTSAELLVKQKQVEENVVSLADIDEKIRRAEEER